jgi:hypothetical protein
MSCHRNERASSVTPETAKLKRTWDSSLSGVFGGCVQAAREGDGQLIGGVRVSVVVLSEPWSTVRCGTRMARAARTNGAWGLAMMAPARTQSSSSSVTPAALTSYL